jgi:hypothetical protein
MAGGLVALHSVCPLEAASVAVRHDPPACLLADGFPRLVARVEPPGKTARVRIAFRPEASDVWHGVTAELTDAGFVAVLPRPRLAARRIHYRFEATGPQADVVTSEAYAADVVADPASCSGVTAENVPSATVMVDVPPGAPVVPPVPPGFDPVGAVSSAPHKGTGKKKIGVLAGVIIGGGAVAAGVAAAGSETPVSTLPSAPTWTVNPPTVGPVSIALNSLSAEIMIISPRTFQPGEAWVVFHNNSTNPPNRPCAVLTGPHPLLNAGERSRFNVSTPFLTAEACGTATLAKLLLRTPAGMQIYSSGNTDLLDASVMYTFVP